MEDFSLFVGFDQIVAAMKFVLYEGFAVFSSEIVGWCFFGLFWVHGSYNFFPLGDGVALSSIGIDEYHNTALSAHHIH